MRENVGELSWPDTALFVAGGLAGNLLGLWILNPLAAAMVAQAPGFWFVSRAAGIVSYLLLWAATAWGVMLSARGMGGLVSAPLAYALHNLTSWLALGFSGVHALSLLGDRVVTFTLAAVLVPFAAVHEPLVTGLGTLSLYIGILVSLTFYRRKKTGYKVWRVVHSLSYLMFLMVTVHGVLLGTDSSTPGMQVLYFTATGSVLFLTLYRVFTAGAQRKPAAGLG